VADVLDGHVAAVSCRAVKLLILLALAAAIIIVILATGWADDKAPPGSQGRAPVTYMPPADSR
jgi:hypothetical protein